MSNKIKFVTLPLYPPSSRGAAELRDVDYRMGLVPEATGSCWYSAGGGSYSTKVCCCVLGPKPVKQVSLTGAHRSASVLWRADAVCHVTSHPRPPPFLMLFAAESSHAILSCYVKFTGVSGKESMYIAPPTPVRCTLTRDLQN